VVPEDVQQEIIAEYTRKANSNYFEKLRAARKYINKRDIQSILRSLDVKHLRESGERKKYSTKYLEKWKSIKKLLGGEVQTYTPEEFSRVGARIMQYSSQWDFHQPPSRSKDRSVYKFKNRKDFPNLNFIIRKIHDDIGLKHLNKDYPLPKTRGSIGLLEEYYAFLDNKPIRKFKQTTLPFLKAPVQTPDAGVDDSGMAGEAEQFLELLDLPEVMFE
jgi:hypothetical protein